MVAALLAMVMATYVLHGGPMLQHRESPYNWILRRLEAVAIGLFIGAVLAFLAETTRTPMWASITAILVLFGLMIAIILKRRGTSENSPEERDVLDRADN